MKQVIVSLIAISLLAAGCKRVTFDNSPCKDKTELVQLGLQSSLQGDISGSFFIGIGGIGGGVNSNLVYHYFVRNQDNSRELRHTGFNDKVHVFEDDPEVPYICSHGEVITGDESYYLIEIHIPKGSITNNYSLDVNKNK